MKDEASFKRVFKKSVKAQGGHSISLSAPMLAGIPDLYVVMPGYMPVLIEAKFFKDLPETQFKRKIPFTDMQKIWIRDCHNVVNYTAMGLVGYKIGKSVYATLKPYDCDKFDTLTENDPYTVRLTDGLFDVSMLFEFIPIPHIDTNVKNGFNRSNTRAGQLSDNGS